VRVAEDVQHLARLAVLFIGGSLFVRTPISISQNCRILRKIAHNGAAHFNSTSLQQLFFSKCEAWRGFWKGDFVFIPSSV